MANWIHQLEIANEWWAAKEGKITLQELAKTIASKLKRLDYKIPEVKAIQEQLIADFIGFSKSKAVDVEEFDLLMNDLYDWGDILVSGNLTFGTRVCWINTIK